MDNEEFYDKVDILCTHLHQVGLDAQANRISHLLHKVAWTTTSELFNALESAFDELLSGTSAARLSQELKDELNGFIRLLDNV